VEIIPLAVCALLGLLALAGCASPAPQVDKGILGASPSSPPALALPWTYTGCREMTASFDADPTTVQAHFPPGFTPGGGTAPGRVAVGMDAFRCQTATGKNGTLHDASYASFWASATPPQQLRGNVSQWYVKWIALVADPASLADLRATNTTVTSGSVDLRDATAGGGTGGTVATIHLDGIGTCTITAGPEAPLPSQGNGQGVRLREFTTTSGANSAGFLVWEARLTRPMQSVTSGTLRVPVGSILADIAGTTTIPVVVGDGSGGGLEGTITRA